MAKTISELRNQSIQVRDASAAGENTATRVGTVLNDIVGHIEDYENTQSSNNSTQDSKIESVKSSLNTEIARAKTEESNLSTLIGTERTERQAAVSSEETARIQADNAEKTARQQADNAEQDARIKADNAEKTARENADITLRTMIQTEVSDREKAVAAEVARAKAAEQANVQAIADENARAMAAEEAETTRATTEEERLQGEIDNTNTNLTTLDDKVNSNKDHFADEVARLDTTDNEIKADLEAETARAKAAEEANAQVISDEIARAQAAEQAIIFDVSAYNNGAVFESISALLGDSNLDTLIPVSFRHGGMTIKYVQTYDNKYVQYRLMSNVWSTTVADWQGVDDEPIAGSNNLVKSGGVANKLAELEKEVDLAPTSNIGSIDMDLELTDKGGYVLARFQNGHLKTKKFDSSKDATEEDRGLMSSNDKKKLNSIAEDADKADVAVSISDADFNIEDENHNVLVKFKNGEVETKYFSSKKTPSQNDIEDYDLVISDENGKRIVGFNNGHIRTKKFDSKNLPSLYEPSMTSQGLSTPVSVVKSSVLLARVVHDFCCCGSSSTIGQVYGYDINSGNSPSASFQDSDNSYGKCLARILDAQCDIAAAGGHTCKSWLSSFKNSLPKHKVYFLWLGLNDSTDSFTDYALGTISDVHVGSEETNANSFYGWYSKVIAHIRSVAPDCLIICLNIPRGYRGEKEGDSTSLKMQSYNKAINDVLQLYKNTLYMDLYQYTPRWREGLLWMQWGHLTPIGYTYLASIVANYLEWLVINYNDSFQRLAYIDKGVYFNKDEVK